MSRCAAIAVCGLAVFSLWTAGCRPSSSAEAGGPPHAKALVIGVSQSTADDAWRAQMSADIEAAAKKHPELELLFKDAADPLQQRAQVEELIAAGVRLIIVCPREAQPLTEPVGKAIAAGIPVLVIDRAIIGDKYTCFLHANNDKIAAAAGRWLAQKLGGKGRIVELEGDMTSTVAQERHNAFRSAMCDPGYRMIFEADVQWKPAAAREEMTTALSRFTQIDAVFAHNDALAHSAYEAAKAAGREKGTIFVGIDALPREGIAYVAEGVLDVSFEYPTGGAEAIDAALKILHGQKLPKDIELRWRMFSKENIGCGGEMIHCGIVNAE